MNTLVCIPIQVDDIDAALADANQAKLLGADIVELRIDSYFPGSEGDEEDAFRLAQLQKLLADCPLPVILTCRSAQEGGDYDGDEADRVSILEKLCIESDHPPAYLDFELASYQKSANIRQKINLCVDHPKQERDVRTRLILSMHDFDGRPANLMRKLADAWAEPAASVVKFAFRARSIRDNLEIFEILRDAPKPTIGLGMGEFGLMSRVLAPKFGGFLTFASLRAETTTAPGQPTIADLLGMYRFRSIGKDTKLYGVIGWPVSQSMSPLIHNAGFEARGVDAVYLPLPIPDSDEALKATFGSLVADEEVLFDGASITLPHKMRIADSSIESVVAMCWVEDSVRRCQSANTYVPDCVAYPSRGYINLYNTDISAVLDLVAPNAEQISGHRFCIYGSGGLGRAIAIALLDRGACVEVRYRTRQSAEHLEQVASVGTNLLKLKQMEEPLTQPSKAYINCTPVGMSGGPDSDGLSIPIHDLFGKVDPETVFFDTVYNPIETPMLKAAKHYGFRTIDGVEMFVKQAAAQFELWTGEQAPIQLFDRLVREKLS